MSKTLAFSLYVVVGALRVLAEDATPQLIDGAITYLSESGLSEKIRVAGRCEDLWVSPDESAIAFVAVLKERGGSSTQEPLIEQSRIYVAMKRNHFAPMALTTQQVIIQGRVWRVFRSPRLSPGLKDVYFSVPDTVTTPRVFRETVATGRVEAVGDFSDYCLIWGGTNSGDLITQERYISEKPSTGVQYRCRLRTGSRGEITIAEDCENFNSSVTAWMSSHGGSCK